MARVYTMFPVCAITVVLVASVQCGITAAVANTTSPPSPILLIHGITGSQLEANVQGAAQSLCNTGGDYELLWVNLVKLAKLIVGINCLDHGLKLNYDAATDTYTPNAGVSVRVAGADGRDVRKAEYLDDFGLVSYFHDMVEYFVDRGYVRDVSIRAAHPMTGGLLQDHITSGGQYRRKLAVRVHA